MTTSGDGTQRDDGTDSAGGAGGPEGIDLTKQSDDGTGGQPDEPAFDPYRFGRPDHPIAPEYAPPGYVPDPPATSPPPGVYPPPPVYGRQGQGGPPSYPPPNYPPSNYSPGYPPPPGHSPHAMQAGTGKATTAMVLGILSIAFFWLTFLDLLLIVPAVVFGIIGIVESNSRGGAGRGKAIAGLICAVMGAVAAIVFLVVALDAVDKCGGIENRNDSGFQQCVQDNF